MYTLSIYFIKLSNIIIKSMQQPFLYTLLSTHYIQSCRHMRVIIITTKILMCRMNQMWPISSSICRLGKRDRQAVSSLFIHPPSLLLLLLLPLPFDFHFFRGQPKLSVNIIQSNRCLTLCIRPVAFSDTICFKEFTQIGAYCSVQKPDVLSIQFWIVLQLVRAGVFPNPRG